MGFKVLFVEMFANVVFVINCLYSAVSLTLVREQRFIIMIYYYNTSRFLFSPSIFPASPF